MRLLQRLRGMLGTALIWGMIAVPLEFVMHVLAASAGAELSQGRMLWLHLANSIVHNAMGGVVFAALVAIGGRRKTLESLRLRDLIVWGGVAGLALPLLGVAEAWQLGVLPDHVVFGLARYAVLGSLTGMLYARIARYESRRLRGAPPVRQLADADIGDTTSALRDRWVRVQFWRAPE